MLVNSYTREVNTIDQGIVSKSIDIIKRAIDSGDRIVNDADHIEKTSLGKAIKHNCSIELIDFLLKGGAKIKAEYKINDSPSGIVIHEYNHLHLALLYGRTNIVRMLLRQGTKIVRDIPFLDIINIPGKNTIFYGICSFIEDDKGNTVYAETELLSHGILTTLNIAFGTHDPKLIQLILQHDRDSFIDNIEDDGTIAHPEFGLQGEPNEYFSYHPYHYNCNNRRLNYADFLHHIDNLNNMNMDIDYLNHRITTVPKCVQPNIKHVPDERIGLLKRYIDTHSRIAYMIILFTFQSNSTIDQNKINGIEMMEFMTKCISSYELELEDITKSINILINDGIINKIWYDTRCSKRFKNEDIKSKVLHYTEKIFNCAKKMSNSMKILKEEAKKIQETMSTVLTDVNVKSISVRVDVLIDKCRSITTS
ncbi:hypothetical protein [Candidatus Mesenet endosymbiont of Agriotes lineatus]|uniref:hypothetical protein n=1 Tax=Candidatus Mesenet endosymbiont of Agriotes lineatus TaxID=3077948 RepID=UPI0030D1B2E9